MARLLIVYHSRTGGSRQMADAAAQAASAEAEVSLKPADQAGSDDLLAADLFARWGLPVILVARTALGTINHSLLSLEALRARGIAVHGVAFCGEANPASEAAIERLGAVRHLGRLPWLDPLDPEGLSAAFAAHIRTELL